MAAAEGGLQKRSRRAAFEQLFAGISAGVVTTVCTHPLDLIKTRMQSESEPFRTLANRQSTVMSQPKWADLCA
jgi:hypothetical protein